MKCLDFVDSRVSFNPEIQSRDRTGWFASFSLIIDQSKYVLVLCTENEYQILLSLLLKVRYLGRYRTLRINTQILPHWTH